MVHVLKGMLIEHNPSRQQFCCSWLSRTNALRRKFITQDTGNTRVFETAEVVNVLQEQVGELMDQNAFFLTQK
ncbi:LOW QUALITY PROTEIN: general transcription factor IIH subunit 5-like [Manis javanica]|uniref:LOW QUALITY PROTEIN: general transcription factor IIH subunit 5-like n=1 Tax=Manis javanica TaxID=9974 RepID=UPI000813544C|nr:LOW QUALITY PROTEIN: general transcription factor IIH subunit 5-like [Manis javanica]